MAADEKYLTGQAELIAREGSFSDNPVGIAAVRKALGRMQSVIDARMERERALWAGLREAHQIIAALLAQRSNDRMIITMLRAQIRAAGLDPCVVESEDIAKAELEMRRRSMGN